MRLRSARDVLAGCLFLAIGLAFFMMAQQYQLGTARSMGTGYFPVVLSLILMAIGLATAARGFLVDGPPIRDVAVKALALVTASIVLFGFLVQGAGLGLAAAGLVLAAAAASHRSRPLTALILAAALSIFCVLVFVRGLGLPFPALGSWLQS
jgi:Tripartite tricarboxylate transporter TctB family